MASSSKNGNGIISGINVTPLVDITLVLLIIFIVTAKIIVTPAMPMDLPHATQAEQLQVVFSVILPVAGPTLVNGETATTDDAVRSLARDAINRDPETRAVINADGAVPHRRVIELLDVLKSAGIAHVAFGALPPEQRAK